MKTVGRRTHILSELDRFAVREHNDGVGSPPSVGQRQLLDHHGQPRRRTQDHRVTCLDDRAPTPPHRFDPLLDAVRDEPDEGAGDQDPEDGDQQRQDPPAPADISRHRPGIEDAEQALPEVLEPRRLLASREVHAERREETGADEYGRQGDDPEPEQDRPGSAGQQVVEAVADAAAETRGVVERLP